MRSWLLSNTTCGTWPPGDQRGSVTSVRDVRPSDLIKLAPQASALPSEPGALATGVPRFEHDLPGEPWEPYVPGLYYTALASMKGSPIVLNLPQADLHLSQFLQTAAHRGWKLLAVSIMCNHFHLVVQVPGDPSPKKILADFKAYGSRVLNKHYRRPPSGTWWTTNGSKRKLHDQSYLANAINYVLYKQPNPLVVWSPERGRII